MNRVEAKPTGLKVYQLKKTKINQNDLKAERLQGVFALISTHLCTVMFCSVPSS